jgi:hypothetical protein
MPHADVDGQRVNFEDSGGDGPLAGAGQRVPGAAHAANLVHPEPADAAIAGFLCEST